MSNLGGTETATFSHRGIKWHFQLVKRLTGVAGANEADDHAGNLYASPTGFRHCIKPNQPKAFCNQSLSGTDMPEPFIG